MLLVWGDSLFLLRNDRELTIQRVDVDGDEKKVALQPCRVVFDAAVPADAQLVVAKQVEDALLATHYPLLIFRSEQEATAPPTKRSPSRKRRRSTETTEKAVDSCYRLFFCILFAINDDDKGALGVQLLNSLEMPMRATVASGQVGAGSGTDSLQVFVTDGPNVLLFERYVQTATVLKLRRPKRGDEDKGFVVWCENVKVKNDVKADTSTEVCVLSCTYVSATYCTNSHLLIQLQIVSRENEPHFWMIVDIDKPQPDKNLAATCVYMPALNSPNDVSTTPTVHATCCCFISDIIGCGFGISPTDGTTLISTWGDNNFSGAKHSQLSASTLLAVGASDNTIYIYTNGILLTSMVLPVRPAEIWCLTEETRDQRYLLGVRCTDANRSFFMIEFSSSMLHASMELLLSFNHVGFALVGEFSRSRTVAGSYPNQVLLLNDVSGIDAKRNGTGSDELCVDENQLIKRSVLITLKLEAKLSCHRLRIHDEKKSRGSSHSHKRARGGTTVGGKIGDTGEKSLFRYIERTQKASSHDKHLTGVNDDDDGTGSDLNATHAQLSKLADSLSLRLDRGMSELKRVRVIVNDKKALLLQLNRLVIQQWNSQQQSDVGNDKSIPRVLDLPPENDGNQVLAEMETLVSGELEPAHMKSVFASNEGGHSASSSSSTETSVVMEEFRLTGYVPSSSLVCAEVVLWNQSTAVLRGVFVSLQAPQDGRLDGWTCSSTVVSEFECCSPRQRARFQLELHVTPSFILLRVQKSLVANLWLHCDSSTEESGASFTSTTVIAPVKLEFGAIAGLQPTSECKIARHDQLLVLSSGSSLIPWAQKLRNDQGNQLGEMVQPFVVRPTYALLDLKWCEHELVLYVLSHMIGNLSPDIYVMINPFLPSHLNRLHLILRSLRSEVLDATKPSLKGNEQEKTKRKTRKAGDAASAHRAMQRDTDLEVYLLAQTLQKRVNFHSMWFDTAANERSGEE